MDRAHIELHRDGTYPEHTSLGGYPLYYIVADGGVLCPECANEHRHLDVIDPEFPNDPPDAQWHIIAQEANWEDDSLYCDHCSARIPSAYAEPEDN